MIGLAIVVLGLIIVVPFLQMVARGDDPGAGFTIIALLYGGCMFFMVVAVVEGVTQGGHH